MQMLGFAFSTFAAQAEAFSSHVYLAVSGLAWTRASQQRPCKNKIFQGQANCLVEAHGDGCPDTLIRVLTEGKGDGIKDLAKDGTLCVAGGISSKWSLPENLLSFAKALAAH